MPNHVLNIVTLYGDEKRIEQLRKEQMQEEGGAGSLDFQKIIPMPESLNIESGSRTKTAIKLYQAANRSGIEEESYAECGERLKEVLQKYDKKLAERIGDFDLEGTLQFGKTAVNNLIRYGAATWYEWCIEHWGTKWNAYSNEQEDEDTIIFETAWSNPEPVMLKLSEMYPETTIEHWWADEDMGSNDGYRVYQGGQIVDGDYCDSCSNEAYEVYIKCWGESECLYQDEDGNWQHHDCDTCHGCD